jgi:putative drug exporter of the RND superfamily
VVAPAGGAWVRDGRRLLTVVPVRDASSPAGRDTLAAVRDATRGLPGVVVGGPAAQDRDLTDAIYGAFGPMVALIALVTVVLLTRAFRSLVLPLKAVVLNVLSVGASFGVIVLFWQQGHGSEAIFGIAQTGAITSWVPLAMFAFLFGLSMDYEVFILSRIRESYDDHGDTDRAVVEGLGHTGRLVTSAALILFLAFLALAAGPGTEIKVFATGLAAGIALDATVVRALVVPALVTLLGHVNWWLPDRLAALLRVPPSR